MSFLLMALHDEKYEIQKAVLTIIGRLSSSIPGIVTNAVRQLILDLLRSLEYSQEPTTIIDTHIRSQETVLDRVWGGGV